MTFPACQRFLRRCAGLAAALLSVLPAGCAKPVPPPPPLVGTWQGAMTAGSVTVPSTWVIKADGTQSQTLTLPQGAITAAGTWTAQAGTLTARTTARVIVLSGEPKVVTLTNPMETAYAYQVRDDTLRLTRADLNQPITLTRERGTEQNRMR